MTEHERDELHPESTDFCMLDYPCAYLPGRMTRMYYRYVAEAGSAFTSAVIQRGWRRFGNYFFHPICEGCDACKSLRIDAEAFRPSRSQRRVVKKNRATRLIMRSPTLSKDHIDLYNRYHAWKAEKDGWKHRAISFAEYHENFVAGAHEFGYEVLYFHDEKLIGVDLIDLVEDGISSIYFFHDPDYAHLSLGTFSLLYQIHLAQTMKKRWIYLGYWVDGCKAFAYKRNFTPQEILDGFPPIEESPPWYPFPPDTPHPERLVTAKSGNIGGEEK